MDPASSRSAAPFSTGAVGRPCAPAPLPSAFVPAARASSGHIATAAGPSAAAWLLVAQATFPAPSAFASVASLARPSAFDLGPPVADRASGRLRALALAAHLRPPAGLGSPRGMQPLQPGFLASRALGLLNPALRPFE